MYQDIERVLLSREEIAGKVADIGKALSEEYRGKTPLVVCLLKGSAIFFADLVRAMDCKLEMDFMAVSSYGGANSTGEVRVLKDLDKSIEGRDVIIVEDIVDTGLTLNYLMKMLKGRGARSLKIVALLDKPSRREVEIHADYVGFTIENYYVVGYGLDYNQQYRNLPEIGILSPVVYAPHA